MEMRQVTKPAKNEDSSTPVGEIGVVVTDERPEAGLKIMAAAASGGAIVDLAFGSVAGLNAAGGAVKKKTKLVPVSAEHIKELEARGPCPPPCFRAVSEHYMIPAESFEEQALLDSFDAIAERLRARHDEDTAILEQYRKYGYAYEEVEVDDDDEAAAD